MYLHRRDNEKLIENKENRRENNVLFLLQHQQKIAPNYKYTGSSNNYYKRGSGGMWKQNLVWQN